MTPYTLQITMDDYSVLPDSHLLDQGEAETLYCLLQEHPGVLALRLLDGEGKEPPGVWTWTREGLTETQRRKALERSAQDALPRRTAPFRYW